MKQTSDQLYNNRVLCLDYAVKLAQEASLTLPNDKMGEYVIKIATQLEDHLNR